MPTPFEAGDQVTVLTSVDVLARATVLDCNCVEENPQEWQVTVLINSTSDVQTLTFRYAQGGEI